MRSFPEDENDKKELERLNAKPWMVQLLSLNPYYCSWGPYEDYMCNKEGGWSAPSFAASWKDFGPWSLDELNELVNFYFEIERSSKPCEACDQSGYNPETKKLNNTFHSEWSHSLTKDELKALKDNNRSTGILGHDAINRWILVETRAKRLGVWGKCKECGGQGIIYTKKNAHVNLILWFIHPRKGCSRGVEIKNIKQNEIPEILKYLKEANNRNIERFQNVSEVADILATPKKDLPTKISKNPVAQVFLEDKMLTS